MELFPSCDKIWAKTRTSIPLAVVFLIIWLVIETTKHRILSWINEQLDRGAGPMIHFLGTIIKWLADNPVSFFVILVAAYCLFVIIGAQLSSFQWPRGYTLLSEAAKKLYKELREDFRTVKYFDSLAMRDARSAGQQEELNLLGAHFIQVTDIFGKRTSFANLERISKDVFGESVIKDGASALYPFGYYENRLEPEFIGLSIKKCELRKAIKEIKAYIQGHFA